MCGHQMHWRHLGVTGMDGTATQFFVLSSLYMPYALVLPSETALYQRELEVIGKHKTVEDTVI